MNKLRIAIFGWKHEKLDQISRIEKGLLELHCELDYNNPQVIFQNNPSYEESLALASFCPKAKLIFNVLDVPRRLNNYPFELIKSQLQKAHVITSISKDTAKDVKEVYGFDSEVIYNPVKEIYRDPTIKKQIDILYVGRLDENKRFHLVLETAKILGKNLHVCGPENPNDEYCTYHGIVDDLNLNLLYNRAKYLICASHLQSGLQLTPCECQFAHCIPIACTDNSVAYELYPDFLADPFADSLVDKILSIEPERAITAAILAKTAPIRYKDLHYLSVAKKILSIYEKIK